MQQKKKYLQNRTQKSGLPPGFLPTEVADKEKSEIHLFQYNEQVLVDKPVDSIEEISIPNNTVSWINIDGIKDSDTLISVGKKFGLHPLLLEDIASNDQRPKIEEQENQLFITLRMMEYFDSTDTFDSDQISFVLGKDYLLTFQEKKGDNFHSNRERIRNAKGKIRKCGADYLLYSLLDTIVDNYYVVLEKTGEKIENLELELIEKADKSHLQELYVLKNDVFYLKKLTWPLRELINKLIRDSNYLIKDETRMYFKDVYDHCLHIIDTIESYRDLLASMMDLYLNSVSNRLNEVMKILTVISTIFIPLTFITSVYGMNFKYMPELEMKYSYPILIVVMLIIISAQLYYFKKKRWLS